MLTRSPLFGPRGPLSGAVLDVLHEDGPTAEEGAHGLASAAHAAIESSTDIIRDEDIQLTLFVLYGLHYGDVLDAGDRWEWVPEVIQARRVLESAFEHALREAVPAPDLPAPTQTAVARALHQLTGGDSPTLARYAAKRATREQLVELIILRSVYTLKEADPHSWAIPRLAGRAKAALVEIQADEYGGGRVDWIHAGIYARTMRSMGLDDTYGTYIDQVPAITLASMNTMSLFGMNRRLRGAIVGHLAAYEMTSAIPSRLYAEGFRRAGYGEDVTLYFDEHVEADAVHEQIAARDLAGSLAEDHPELLPDIFFGAAASLTVDGWAGQRILEAWSSGRSALRIPLGADKVPA